MQCRYDIRTATVLVDLEKSVVANMVMCGVIDTIPILHTCAPAAAARSHTITHQHTQTHTYVHTHLCKSLHAYTHLCIMEMDAALASSPAKKMSACTPVACFVECISMRQDQAGEEKKTQR